MSKEQKKQVAHFYRTVFIWLFVILCVILLYTALKVVKNTDLTILKDMMWYIGPVGAIAAVAAARGMAYLSK